MKRKQLTLAQEIELNPEDIERLVINEDAKYSRQKRVRNLSKLDIGYSNRSKWILELFNEVKKTKKACK